MHTCMLGFGPPKRILRQPLRLQRFLIDQKRLHFQDILVTTTNLPVLTLMVRHEC